MECEWSRWRSVQVAEIGESLSLRRSVSFNAPVEYPKAPCIIDNAQLCGLPIRLQKDREREGEADMY
jgi:hypothetical protein